MCKRLEKCNLTLEPTQTKWVAFGRFAQRDAQQTSRKRPETLYFLGFTLYCTRNLKGRFKLGMRTEKSRLRRSLMSLQDLMRRIRHWRIREQVKHLNAILRRHYAYYGLAGNFPALQRIYEAVKRYWRKMLGSRSGQGRMTWKKFNPILTRFPLQRPERVLPYGALRALAVL